MAAENAVLHLPGVKTISNLITIKPTLAPVEVKTAIKAAFERHALLDASGIQVEASGNKVVLRGTVQNYIEREEAERAAWAAAGVLSVDNQLQVGLPVSE
jgi:osmotically-inducible protein OsmY